jgi:ABC-2 type transport system ATP-binding protein
VLQAKFHLRLTRVLAVISISFASLLVNVYAEAESVSAQSINTATGISIDTNLYLPGKVPAPAIMIAHGFGGNKDSVAQQAKYFQSKGYVVLTWSARGFGKSTGQIEMNSLNAEVADTKALITYLAEQKSVKLDATGDPVVGIMGASYGGANSLLTASTDNRIDAVIADITWSNLNQDLFPQAITSGLGSDSLDHLRKFGPELSLLPLHFKVRI